MWRFVNAQVTGSSHERTATPCQDSMACESVNGSTFLAVVADGAGSASHSEHGSKLVVDTVMAHARFCLAEGETDLREILYNGIAEARVRLIELASVIGVGLREVSTTVLAVIIAPHDGVAMQIGDGVIAISEDINEWCWVMWPQHGEFINTTSFLTDDEALQRMEEAKLPPTVLDICLCSDGLESLALNYIDRTAHSPFYSALFKELHPIYEADEMRVLSDKLELFIGSERIRSRTSDDISIILATRR